MKRKWKSNSRSNKRKKTMNVFASDAMVEIEVRSNGEESTSKSLLEFLDSRNTINSCLEIKKSKVFSNDKHEEQYDLSVNIDKLEKGFSAFVVFLFSDIPHSNPASTFKNIDYTVKLPISEKHINLATDSQSYASLYWITKQLFIDVIGSTNKVKSAISLSMIKVNGTPCKSHTYIVKCGDVISLDILSSNSGMLRLPITEKDAHKFEVLHENEQFAVIWKPPNLSVNDDDDDISIIPSLKFNLKATSETESKLPSPFPTTDIFHVFAGLTFIAKTKAGIDNYIVEETWEALCIGKIEDKKRFTNPEKIDGEDAVTIVTPIGKPTRSKRCGWLTRIHLTCEGKRLHRQYITQMEKAGFPLVGCGNQHTNVFSGKGRFLTLTEMTIIPKNKEFTDISRAISSSSSSSPEAASTIITSPLVIHHDCPSKFLNLPKREERVWEQDVKERCMKELGPDATEDQVNRCVSGEPLAYIKGKETFFGFEFLVNSNVMIPRKASEVLVSSSIEFLRNKINSSSDKNVNLRILDLGTGSACLLLSTIKSLLPTITCSGVGLDISEGALKVAQANAKNLDLLSHVTFIQGDFSYLDNVSQTEGPFDLILCNPPYKSRGGTRGLDVSCISHEPSSAFYTGCAGLESYIAIHSSITKLMNNLPISNHSNSSQDRSSSITPILKSDGLLCFEVGPKQGDKVANDIFKTWRIVDFVNDTCGIQRCVMLQPPVADKTTVDM